MLKAIAYNQNKTKKGFSDIEKGQVYTPDL